MNKLGEQYDCNSGTIYYFLKEYNYLKPSKNFKRTKDCSDKIINLFNSGMSMYQISKEVDIKTSSIQKFLQKQGIDTSRDSTQRKYGDKVKDYKDVILQLYNEGSSTGEIARLIGCKQPSVWKLLKLEGIETRDNTTYSVDDTFFSQINTQEKAYILGWMYSDGNVMPAGKLRIQIQSEDDYILQWIKEQVKYTGPLYDIPPRKGFEYRKNQTCLSINRKSMVDDLIKLGCVPNKSLTLQFPTFDIIPDYLMPHFIRGFFDGDGCISCKVASITCTDSFITDLNKYLINNVGIEGGNFHYRYKNKNTVCYKLRRNDTLKFLHWIYKDSTIHLSRKHLLYQELCV
jgi:transposase-like protein